MRQGRSVGTIAAVAAALGAAATAAPAGAADFALTGTFGWPTGPNAAFEFHEPAAIAVNSTTGDVYVGDQWPGTSGRIQWMGAGGTFKGTWAVPMGSSTSLSPTGLAVDDVTGDVFVHDNFLKVHRYAADFMAVDTVDLMTPLATPAMAFDATQQRLYLADGGQISPGVHAYTPDGTHVATGADGTAASPAWASGVTVDPVRDVVYVTDLVAGEFARMPRSLATWDRADIGGTYDVDVSASSGEIYGAAGTQIRRWTAEHTPLPPITGMTDVREVAVNSRTGAVYALEQDHVKIFQAPPVASLSPSSHDFGAVRAGTTASTTFTITSEGPAGLTFQDLQLTGPQASSFSVDPGTCAGALVPANETCELHVSFAPAAAADASATLRVVHPGGAVTAELQGRGVEPAATFDPGSVDFGARRVGTTATDTVTLRNTGSAPLAVGATSVTGSGAFTVTADGCAETTVAVDAACEVEVRFAPAATGAASATLRIDHDAPGAPSTVDLAGTGTEPAATVDPGSIAFGDQRVGTTSPTQTVTVRNTGTAPLAVGATSLTGSGAFTIASDTCADTTVAVDAACEVEVRFAPTATGAASATLRIDHDAPGAPSTVDLTGTGTQSAATVDPASVDFGGQRTGTTSAPRTVTLRNTGTASLTTGATTLTGTGAGQFAVVQDGCASRTLDAGQQCEVHVRFAPTTATRSTAALRLAHDAPGGPAVVPLAGEGTCTLVRLNLNLLGASVQVCL